eukprot:scaffold80874_cov60-Phaeocystis_antarctica.AAC.1
MWANIILVIPNPGWPGVNGPVHSSKRAKEALDMLPAQPAHTRPHLRTECTLHGIVDRGTLERLGNTTKNGRHQLKEISPPFSAGAELRGPFLAEGAHKEALAEPGRPQ